MTPITPATAVDTLYGDLQGSPEQSYITCIADVGEYEVFTATFVAFASCGQADFFTFTEPHTGETFAVWLDKDANGTTPTGATYVAATNKVEVDIVTGDTAAQVGQKVKTALALVAASNVFVVSGAAAILTFTANLVGTATDAANKVADGTTAGSIVCAVTTQGVASNLNSKYLTLRNAADAVFYVWIDLNSQGSNPAPGGTGIEADVSKGATAAQVATAVAAAIDGHADFEAESDGARVKVTNVSNGASTNVAVGNSPFTVAFQSEGSAAKKPGPADATAGLTNF